MKKAGVLVTVLLISILLLTNITLAQQGIEDIGEGIQEQAEVTQEFIEEKKLEFLGQQWKEFFLENEFITGANERLTKLNPVFVILFARNYSFSLIMLFVFMLWLFTLLSLPGYMVFLENENYQWLAALAGTIILAHIQIFNFIANGAVKVIFYKSSTLWSIVTFVIVIIALVFYLYLNKLLAGKIKKAKEEAKKHKLEYKVKKTEKYIESLEEGRKG